MKRFISQFVIAAMAIFLWSCSDSNGDEPQPGETRRAVLVYMVATNSLGANGSDSRDLQEIEKAFVAGVPSDCRLLVYHAPADNSAPALKEISVVNHKAKWVTLADYDNSVEGGSVTVERMRQVITDFKNATSATDYGLILWSHASGWAVTLQQSDATPAANRRLRSFGDDNGHAMPLDRLAEALPDGLFRFICADVCYFSCVEAAYELRNKCRYLMASPTEVPTGGMPYDITLPYLLKSVPDITGACQATFNYYNSLSGVERTFAGAVIDCSQMDNLANVCAKIFAAKRDDPPVATLQSYNLYKSTLFYDFKQYYLEIAPDNEALKAEFTDAVEKVVVYHNATPFIFNRLAISPENYSGLSTYVLGASSATNDDYYKTLGWYKRVVEK